MIDPATYNITIQRGATFSRTMQLKDGDGVPLNLTGYTVKAQMWQDDKRSKLADFTVTWVSRSTGQFTISLNAATTAALGLNGYWDLLVDSGTAKDYWLRGTATVVEGYTE